MIEANGNSGSLVLVFGRRVVPAVLGVWRVANLVVTINEGINCCDYEHG